MASPPESFVGRILSHYRVEQRVGGGGMGMLYRATDLRIGRTVAIKLLARHLASDDSAKARFIREARATSALDHPNIATLYEVDEENGELFIAMALYQGETLKQRLGRGRLRLEEALEILRQVTRGLEAAHRAGIIHRDIKPANILITSGGTVKILDFGLAKDVSDQSQTMTPLGQTMGTLLYMSPEQFRGDRVDARSDLWSLGVVAHELLAGVSPFASDSSATTVARILHGQAASLNAVPGVPDWLAALVSQLLRKNLAERPQSATEVLQRLEAAPAIRGSVPEPPPRLSNGRRGARLGLLLAGPGAIAVAAGTLWYFLARERPFPAHAASTATSSIAVLPFADMSPAKDQEYFSDGIAEEILYALAQVQGLRVVGRTSAFSFKGRNEDLRSIGRKLNVAHVLEGSVRKQGDRVRIKAELVSVADGYDVWSQNFDRDLKDVFAVQEEIAKSVVDGLKLKLMPGRTSAAKERRTSSVEAYDQYLAGMQILNQYSREETPRARDALERAVALDPGYGPGWSGLSMAYALLSDWALTPAEQHRFQQQALDAADKAVELAPDLAETWARRALWRMQLSWDWQGAQADIDHAIALNPRDVLSNDARARLYAMFGQVEAAIAAGHKTTALDPLNFPTLLRLCHYLMGGGQLEAARRALDRAQEIMGQEQGVSWVRSRLDLLQDRAADALSRAERTLTWEEFEDARLITRAMAQHALGRAKESQQTLEEVIAKWGAIDAYQVAEIYAMRGESDRAFEWLERAYAQHDGGFVAVLPNNCSLKCDPFLRGLRGDPRWAALLKKMNLPLD